jgi:hypothetical protein
LSKCKRSQSPLGLADFPQAEIPLLQGKEVNPMTYSKPEIMVLGDANVVIQGEKRLIHDGGASPGDAPAETVE